MAEHKESMPTKDRACFNCEAYGEFIIPARRDEPMLMYKALCFCRQRLSDHYLHILDLKHICSWHSEYLKEDERFKEYKQSIDK
jgi:hypothetical protein